MGLRENKFGKFQTDPDPLTTQKLEQKAFLEAEKQDRDIVESMQQIEWFDKSQLSKNKSNRYPKASYKEAQDYSKRFRELMEQKKMQREVEITEVREHKK